MAKPPGVRPPGDEPAGDEPPGFDARGVAPGGGVAGGWFRVDAVDHPGMRRPKSRIQRRNPAASLSKIHRNRQAIELGLERPVLPSSNPPRPERAVGLDGVRVVTDRAKTAATPVMRGATGRGWWVPEVLAPSWPQSVLPQPRRKPSPSSASVWRPVSPGAIAVTFVTPGTGCGVARAPVTSLDVYDTRLRRSPRTPQRRTKRVRF